MKKNIIVLLIAICFVLMSCDYPFTGYIVHKTWVKAHMDNQYPEEINKAGYVPVFHPTPVVHHYEPKKILSEFIIYVANKDDVRMVKIDSVSWFKYRICQKITIK